MTLPRYRAWHIAKQNYIPVRNILCASGGEPFAISSGGLDSPRIPISDVVLERWTGHTDRHGNPIFENDILQRFNTAYGDMYAANIMVVTWRETAMYTGFGLTERGCKTHLILGNVHEHAELLAQGVVV